MLKMLAQDGNNRKSMLYHIFCRYLVHYSNFLNSSRKKNITIMLTKILHSCLYCKNYFNILFFEILLRFVIKIIRWSKSCWVVDGLCTQTPNSSKLSIILTLWALCCKKSEHLFTASFNFFLSITSFNSFFF